VEVPKARERKNLGVEPPPNTQPLPTYEIDDLRFFYANGGIGQCFRLLPNYFGLCFYIYLFIYFIILTVGKYY